MTILITLVLPPGGDAGPFNLYSNTDGYVAAFATNISAAALQAGYTALFVPEGTTTIRVTSIGVCTNFVNVQVNVLPTTTTTSSSSTSTTTSTSTTAGLTTTSTTTATPSTTTTTSSSSTSTSTSTSTSSTTTTTTTFPIGCYEYTLIAFFPEDLFFEYVDCVTGPQDVTLNSEVVPSVTVCATSVTPPAAPEDKWDVVVGDECVIPTTTTTTTMPLQEGFRSTTSDPSDACGLPLTEPCWISGTGDISTGDTVYTDALGTTPFIGDGDFYNVKILSYPNSYSVQISSGGVIDASLGGICP
jgi:hypothetical protein